MFKIGEIYSTADLLKTFKGNKIPCMPIIDGKVSYCKFDPRINPNFPKEAWIEEGLRRRKGAELMIFSHEKIPVFEKIKTGHWRYLGTAKVHEISDSERINRINENPPREKIQKIISFDFD